MTLAGSSTGDQPLDPCATRASQTAPLGYYTVFTYRWNLCHLAGIFQCVRRSAAVAMYNPSLSDKRFPPDSGSMHVFVTPFLRSGTFLDMVDLSAQIELAPRFLRVGRFPRSSSSAAPRSGMSFLNFDSTLFFTGKLYLTISRNFLLRLCHPRGIRSKIRERGSYLHPKIYTTVKL